MRGSPKQPALGDHARRSIPASAGEPSGSRSYTDRYWVYPRECGGAVRSTLPLHIKQGLSPRVRGSRRHNGSHRSEPRSIPASAGEPSTTTMPTRGCEVYPRECGGAFSLHHAVSRDGGLSPRVRGSPERAALGDHARRSIPASAGEPQNGKRGKPEKKVYPRECGGAATNDFGGRTR